MGSKGRTPVKREAIKKPQRAHSFAVNFQGVGSAPDSVTLKGKGDLTISNLAESVNVTEVGNYRWSVNGRPATASTVLKKGDNVRLGFKTKNG